MSFFLAPALVALRNEVNKKYPNRDTASDGWIGDPSHAARVSDHNPCWNCSGRLNGIVRAIDIDIDDRSTRGDLRRDLLKAAIGDPRVWYVISNGIIYSRTHDFAAHRYTGSNPHDKHVHISLRHGVREFDTSRWLDTPRPKPTRRIDKSVVRDEFLKAIGEKKGKVQYRHAVRFLQQALNAEYPNRKVKADGWVGDATLDLWGHHERGRRGTGRPRVPDDDSLRRLVRNRPRFKLID